METNTYTDSLVGGWLGMVSAGSDLWARFLSEVAAGIRPADTEIEKEAMQATPEKEKKTVFVDLSCLESVVRERQAIRRDAYYLWLQRKNAGQAGNALEDWVQAERRHHL